VLDAARLDELKDEKDPHRWVRGVVQLTNAAMIHITTQRRIDAKQLARNTGISLRFAIDRRLKDCSVSNIGILTPRLDRLIDSTRAYMDAIAIAGGADALIDETGHRLRAGPWNKLLEDCETAKVDLLSAINAVGEDDDGATSPKLPQLQAHDRQAWQLSLLHDMTQQKIAEALNNEHGTTYTQGQVSRMIARAKANADASGLSEKVAGRIDRPLAVDPERLELGKRVDKRKPRPSDTARVNDDDE
jgi:hypothetical protein